jgi:hypothetical protein
VGSYLNIQFLPTYFSGGRIAHAILHRFILAEKTDLFHTPNLRYLKNIQIFKMSPTLTQLSKKSIFRLDFCEPHPPTAAGGESFIAISSVLSGALTGLLEGLNPTLKYLVWNYHGGCET